jgi:Fe-S-cluster-containing dehydrogenase component
MNRLDVPWKEIETYLETHIPEFKTVRVMPADKGRFFKIHYEPGEIIMPKGVYSDYAAVHLTGDVFVYDRAPASRREAAAGRECWRKPGRLRKFLGRPVAALAGGLSRIAAVVRRRGEKPTVPADLDSPLAGEFESAKEWGRPSADGFIKRTHFQGTESPIYERLMGVSSALLNQQRSFTLVAGFGDGHDAPCEFYLIPRRILAELYKLSPAFRARHSKRFVADELPRLLAENRLFRNTLYPADILDRAELLSQLRGSGDLAESAASRHPRYAATGRDRAEASRRLRACLGDSCKGWLKSLSSERLDDAALAQLLGDLNALLKRPDLFGKPQPPATPGNPKPTQNQVIAANRRRLEQVYVGAIAETDPDRFLPTEPHEFEKLIAKVGAEHFRLLVRPELGHPEGAVIFAGPSAPGEPGTAQDADALYLIISGQVHIERAVPGTASPLLLNRLDRHGYFGLSCIEVGAKHSASARAMTEVHLIELRGDVVRDTLMPQFPAIAKKLREETARVRARDAQLGSGARMPPATPPTDVANRLMVTTNLLLVDMDLCTRCDQCVAGCAAAHDDIPRFHRGNPDLRFGKWEVAKACMHCVDAPCQRVCPVGAITFLDTGAVEIHRNRCIGCEYCALACPFDVIEMAVAAPGEPLCVKPEKPIATKCDLCLDEDHAPPCVASCPYGAAQRGHPRDLFPDIKNWAESIYSR